MYTYVVFLEILLFYWCTVYLEKIWAKYNRELSVNTNLAFANGDSFYLA